MAAIPGQLDAPLAGASRRGRPRRTLHLRAQETASLGGAEVIILDISTTGLLLQTSGELSADETIALELPGAAPVSATVKWSSGQYHGCEFAAPVSDAFVSAALLRSPPEPAAAMPKLDPAALNARDEPRTGRLSGRARVAIVAGLTVLCWSAIAGIVLALI
jgi:hypothetical protein